MQKHGSIDLYVHGNHKARSAGQPRTATSTLTQLLNYVPCRLVCHVYVCAYVFECKVECTTFLLSITTAIMSDMKGGPHDAAQ